MRRASFGLYQGLGQFFDRLDELASAGCMSPRRCRDCLDGKKSFTPQEQKAIANEIIAKMVTKQIDNYQMLVMIEAREDFDKVFRSEEAA